MSRKHLFLKCIIKTDRNIHNYGFRLHNYEPNLHDYELL